MINLNGEIVTISSICKKHNLPWSTVKNRLISGHSGESLTVKRLRDTRFNGDETTLAKISEKTGLPLSLIKSRYAIGLRDDDLVIPIHLGTGNERAASKLNVEKVEKIKKLLLLTDLTQREIGDIFGIDQSHVSDIKRGKRWAKVKIDIEKVMEDGR